MLLFLAVLIIHFHLLFGAELPTADMSNLAYYKPTQEEWKRAIAVSPPAYWGRQVFDREDVSLRILAAGGSNTAYGYYVNFLQKGIQQSISPSSYVINGGVSGAPPSVRKYLFEQTLPPQDWPNVIILEYAINCADSWECVKSIEHVMSYLNSKYEKHNMTAPYYLLFELFRIDIFYANWKPYQGPKWTANCKKVLKEGNPNMTFLSPPKVDYNSFGFNHGSRVGPYLGALARFYRIPLITAVDALFPSWVRYYETHAACSRWPYSLDGVHLSEWGFQSFVNTVLTPFFVNVHKQFLSLRNEVSQAERQETIQEMEKSEVTDRKTKLFPVSSALYQVKGLVAEWNAWGVGVPNELAEIVVGGIGTKPQDDTFSFQAISEKHDDGSHVCLRSDSSSGTARLILKLPSRYFHEVNDDFVNFRLSVETVHSWNTSFIGDLSCQVYRSPKNYNDERHFEAMRSFDNPKLLEEYYPYPLLKVPHIIHGNRHPDHTIQDPLRDTVPRATVLTNELKASMYLLECKKMDPKVVCISRVVITEV